MKKAVVRSGSTHPINQTRGTDNGEVEGVATFDEVAQGPTTTRRWSTPTPQVETGVVVIHHCPVNGCPFRCQYLWQLYDHYQDTHAKTEDVDLIDYINQGDRVLTQLQQEGRRLSRLLDLLETKEE